MQDLQYTWLQALLSIETNYLLLPSTIQIGHVALLDDSNEFILLNLFDARDLRMLPVGCNFYDSISLASSSKRFEGLFLFDYELFLFERVTFFLDALSESLYLI